MTLFNPPDVMGRSNTYSTFVPFFNVVVDVVVVIFVVFFDIAVSFGNIFTADVLARGVKRARFLNAFGSLSLIQCRLLTKWGLFCGIKHENL